MSNCSNIVMKSDAVIKLANDCITNIKKYRTKCAREWCEEERKSWSTRFWARLTRSPLPTDEEILAVWAADDSVFNKHFMINMLCWESERAARRLLLAAEYADEVSVSVQDLALVS